MNNRRKLLVALGTSALAVTTLMGYLIWSGYLEAIRAAETMTRNYVAINKARLDATLRRADADLQSLVLAIPVAALSKRAVPHYARELDAMLDSHAVNFEELAGLRVFDSDGDLLYTTDRKTTPSTNIADRSSFSLLRDNPQAGLVFSEVIVSRTTGRQTMPIGRALRNGQGTFLGIVSATLELNHFQSLFQSLDLGPRGAIAVYRSDDLRLIVRWPHVAGEVNKPLDPQHPIAKRIAAGDRTATLQYAAQSDGVQRVSSYQTLGNYPFYVNVGVSRDDVLAEWRTRSLAIGTISLLLLLLLAGMLLRLRRTEARQAQVMSDLAQSEERFRAIFNHAGVGITMRPAHDRHHPWVQVNDQFCKLLGYTREELLGLSTADITPPDERKSAVADNESLLRGEIENYSREKQVIRKDGRRIWVNLAVAALFDADGHPRDLIAVYQDITARKRSEEARAYLAAIVASSSDAIVSRSLDDKILSWNAGAEHLFGYTADEAIGQSISMIFPPDREEEIARNRALLAQGRSVIDLETVRLAKGGRRIDVSLSQSPIKDEHGKIVGIALVFRDIRERKQAEEARARLAAIVENSSDAIFIRDLDGKIIFWNDGATRVYGYTSDEMIGTDGDIAIPPDLLPEREQKWEEVRQGGTVANYETVRVHKDGHRVDVSISMSPIKDRGGKIIGVARISRDISERKQAEARLRLAASVFDSAAEGIMITDADNNIVSVNRAFTNITGYSAQEVIGKNPRLHQSGQQTPAFYEQMWASIKESGCWKGEIWDRRKDGTVYCELLSITAVRDEHGEIIQHCGVFMDITERKQAEVKLARLNVELETRVTERTADLAAANRELEAFSYSVAHDLRAPLRALNGYSALVLEANESKLDQASVDNLKRVRATGERMGELIDDLLNLTRLSCQEMQWREFNLSELAASVVASLTEAYPERNVPVTTQPDMNTNGDSGLMRIALENLIGNAWKFTTKTGAARIEVGTEQRDGQTVYYVRDNGAGFDMKYVHKLFAPFQRLHRSDEFEGTGIGLATVKKIIERHSGKIWIESAIDVGTTVFFTVGKSA